MVYSSANFLGHPSKHLMTRERVEWMIISQHKGCSFLVIQKNHKWPYNHKSLKSKSYIFMQLYVLYDLGFYICLYVVIYVVYLVFFMQTICCFITRFASKERAQPWMNNQCGIALLKENLSEQKSQIMIYMPHSYVVSKENITYITCQLYSFKQNISNIWKTVGFSLFLCMFFLRRLSLPFFLKRVF